MQDKVVSSSLPLSSNHNSKPWLGMRPGITLVAKFYRHLWLSFSFSVSFYLSLSNFVFLSILFDPFHPFSLSHPSLHILSLSFPRLFSSLSPFLFCPSHSLLIILTALSCLTLPFSLSFSFPPSPFFLPLSIPIKMSLFNH